MSCGRPGLVLDPLRTLFEAGMATGMSDATMADATFRAATRLAAG